MTALRAAIRFSLAIAVAGCGRPKPLSPAVKSIDHDGDGFCEDLNSCSGDALPGDRDDTVEVQAGRHPLKLARKIAG